MIELQERMFFFPGSKGRELLGFLHLPPANFHDTGIVFIHPFAEEKNCSHAVVVKTARALAKTGYPVLRFDLSGCGDSQGDLQQVTPVDWLNDIETAKLQLKNCTNVTKVALWGLRLGAGLALATLSTASDCPFAILWQPVLQFKDYIHQFLRQKLSSNIAAGSAAMTSVKSLISQLHDRQPVEVMGYVVHYELYNSFLNMDDHFLKPKLYPRLLIVSVSLQDSAPFPLMNYVKKLPAVSVDFSHIVEEPFWDRYWRWEAPLVTQTTLDWLLALTKG